MLDFNVSYTTVETQRQSALLQTKKRELEKGEQSDNMWSNTCSEYSYPLTLVQYARYPLSLEEFMYTPIVKFYVHRKSNTLASTIFALKTGGHSQGEFQTAR